MPCSWAASVVFSLIVSLLDARLNEYYHCCTCSGHKYDKFIKLYNLKCKELPKLRFIVQNKWWYNPYGKVRAFDTNTTGTLLSAMHTGQQSWM